MSAKKKSLTVKQYKKTHPELSKETFGVLTENKELLKVIRKEIKIPKGLLNQLYPKATLQQRIKEIRRRYRDFLFSTDRTSSGIEIPVLDGKPLNKVSMPQRRAYRLKEEMNTEAEDPYLEKAVQKGKELQKKVNKRIEDFQKECKKLSDEGYKIRY